MTALAPATRKDYRENLHGLLPQGEAWPKQAGTTLDRLLDALAGEFLAVDGGGMGVLGESVPSGAFHLLPDWERLVGLPDACSDLSETIGHRRAAVVGKVVSLLGVSPHDIVALGRRWGYRLRVREPASEAAVTGTTLDLTGGKWRFVWYVDIGTIARFRYFDTLSDVLTPLCRYDGAFPNEFICRLRELVPAHTLLVIGYFQAPEVLTWLGQPLTWHGDPLGWPGA